MAFRIDGIGTTFRRKTLSEGSFNCPNVNCKGKRDGALHQTFRSRSERKWFSLLWIPIVPIGDAREYAECKSCHKVCSLDAVRHAGVN